MITVFIQGVLISGGLIIAIGAQNAFIFVLVWIATGLAIFVYQNFLV